MEGDTDSFIVRIWHEAVDRAGNVLAWKGYIEQVGADRHLYFQDLDVMARFIQGQCRLPPGVGAHNPRGESDSSHPQQ